MPNEKRRQISPLIRQRARELRQPQTPAEVKLWRVLRDRNLGGYKFRRQHPIGQFIVDFYCAQVKLVVEIDGDTHAEQEDYDASRTEWLQGQGLFVIRFTNRDVFEQIAQVSEVILVACKNCS